MLPPLPDLAPLWLSLQVACAATLLMLFPGILAAWYIFGNAVSTPLLSVLVDRHGQRRVLLPAAAAHAVAVIALAVLLRTDAAYGDKAARVSALAKDVSEYLAGLDLPAAPPSGISVAYHYPCSLQHGQGVTREPRVLLARAGFVVKDVPEGHLCCGSAGTYNMLQPEIAGALAARKAANIERVSPDVIATSNLGCMVQIGQATTLPIVHLVELIDWATGGPRPDALQNTSVALANA